MSEKTLFQKIADKEIPADIVFEDEHCVCFREATRPHRFISCWSLRKPIARLTAVQPADHAILGHLLVKARTIAEQQGIAADGFRVIINNGPHAGEEIPHLHIHLLAGKPLGPMLTR